MWENKKFIFCILIVSNFSDSDAFAKTVKDIVVGKVIIHPFAQDQLEVGSNIHGNQHSSPSASGPHIRNGVRINIANQVKIGAIWDFGAAPGGQMRLFEGAASYTGLKHFQFSVGVFNPSFGLSSMQSRGDSIFPERASVATITRGLAAGANRQAVQALFYGNYYHLAISGTAGTAGPGKDGNQRAIVFRSVILPIHTQESLMHVGISGEWVFRPSHKNSMEEGVSFSDTPENDDGLNDKYIKTGNIPAKSSGAFGLEGAVAWKKLLISSEYYNLIVNENKNSRINRQNFYGWYITAAYTLVGKPRAWKPTSASFASPSCDQKVSTLCHAMGVIELATRFSQMDLENSDVSGGKQNIWSVNINWYPLDIIRISLDYSHTKYYEKENYHNFDSILSMFQVYF